MKEIKCPYDLNQFLLGEPIFENPFPEEECTQRKFYGDCYHCFSTAIASRDHQLKHGMTNKIKAIVAEWKTDTWTDNFSYECMRKIADLIAESGVEDMQIVIDIDENVFTRLFDNGVCNYDDAVDMAKAIRKGTPPKHIECEDCISRAEALKGLALANNKDETYRMIRELPPVTPQPKTDVLNKIRAEIEQEYNRLSATRDETLELGECLGLKMSLKIIDKYTAESER